jgi:cold shock CspA family protein
MASNNDVVTPSDSESLIGRVKWFNNKAGYGFITVTDGPRADTDVFVHHSAVQVENQQYKYLVQGEYVEFGLTHTTSGSHEWQASKVSGIKGGKLMCETRRDFKLARSSYKNDGADESDETPAPRQQRAPRESRPPRQNSAPRARGEGPRDGDKKEWTLVAQKGPSKTGGRGSRGPRQTSEAK